MTENLHILIALLLILIAFSAFFSAAETSMMATNRYRLRHLIRQKHRAAKRVLQLLRRPDRLLGVILIGSTFANILAASVATLIAASQFGKLGVALSPVILTFVILILAEVTPKTLAALYPERIAFIAAWPLKVLLALLYPIVWVVNTIANSLLRFFSIKVRTKEIESLTHEELRTIVHEATGKISGPYQEMLLHILDLDKATVEDIMIPRQDVIGIDINDAWENILQQLTVIQHTRLPLYRESIDNVLGILHLRKALNLLAQNRLDKSSLLKCADEAYFVPEGTPLNVQLIQFRQEKHRSALVVDEYGDIQGLITLEDILEEIVGEFTTNLPAMNKAIQWQKDGSYLVDGGIMVRELNRLLHLKFPTEGPKTLNGLIIEYLESLPATGISLRIAGYPLEIITIEENTVKTAQIWPALYSEPVANDTE
ncbi:MAG: HlyC/CorC family transporter [Gammaproteobacteria bacterium]